MASHRARQRQGSRLAMRPRRARGFSVVELVVTLVVLSILAAFAVPQLSAVINTSRVTGEANNLLAGMQLARMEAIRGNVRTVFCSADANGTACTGATPWVGWLVFADRDFDNNIDPGEIVRAGNIEAPLQVRASSNLAGNRITFRSDGIAYNGNALLTGNVRVCIPRDNPPQNSRDISIAAGGRFAVRPAAIQPTTCPAPGN